MLWSVVGLSTKRAQRHGVRKIRSESLSKSACGSSRRGLFFRLRGLAKLLAVFSSQAFFPIHKTIREQQVDS